MRPFMIPTMVLTMVAAGCGSQSVAPLTPLLISGKCELSIGAATGPAPTPPVVRQTDKGTCDLTTLGRVAFDGVLEINPVAGTQVGDRTLTASNGDILRMKSVGTSSLSGPGLVSFVATITFVGGTGRFIKASGQGRAEGTANVIMGKTTLTIDGTIDN